MLGWIRSGPRFPGHAGWDTFSSLEAGTKMELEPTVLSSSARQDPVVDLLMGSITAPGQNHFDIIARG